VLIYVTVDVVLAGYRRRLVGGATGEWSDGTFSRELCGGEGAILKGRGEEKRGLSFRTLG